MPVENRPPGKRGRKRYPGGRAFLRGDLDPVDHQVEIAPLPNLRRGVGSGPGRGGKEEKKENGGKKKEIVQKSRAGSARADQLRTPRNAFGTGPSKSSSPRPPLRKIP